MYFIVLNIIAKKILGLNNYKMCFKKFKATIIFVLINLNCYKKKLS